MDAHGPLGERIKGHAGLICDDGLNHLLTIDLVSRCFGLRELLSLIHI